MKEIIAIIRANKWQATKKLLLDKGITSYTVQRVFGRGKQKGLIYLSKSGTEVRGISYLPKRMVTLFVRDEEVSGIIDLLIGANRTGEIGDGKIFVCPLESAERIRTGEKSEAVVA
jgi:nitrogen regulatory protein PII 2